jgi:hypothetical protein
VNAKAARLARQHGRATGTIVKRVLPKDAFDLAARPDDTIQVDKDGKPILSYQPGKERKVSRSMKALWASFNGAQRHDLATYFRRDIAHRAASRTA